MRNKLIETINHLKQTQASTELQVWDKKGMKNYYYLGIADGLSIAIDNMEELLEEEV